MLATPQELIHQIEPSMAEAIAQRCLNGTNTERGEAMLWAMQETGLSRSALGKYLGLKPDAVYRTVLFAELSATAAAMFEGTDPQGRRITREVANYLAEHPKAEQDWLLNGLNFQMPGTRLIDAMIHKIARKNRGLPDEGETKPEKSVKEPVREVSASPPSSEEPVPIPAPIEAASAGETGSVEPQSEPTPPPTLESPHEAVMPPSSRFTGTDEAGSAEVHPEPTPVPPVEPARSTPVPPIGSVPASDNGPVETPPEPPRRISGARFAKAVWSGGSRAQPRTYAPTSIPPGELKNSDGTRSVVRRDPYSMRLTLQNVKRGE